MMPQRIHPLNERPLRPGPVVYWMSRDQRVADNWALLHAQELAIQGRHPLAVVFTLVPEFLGAALRQYAFMLKGLQQVAERLAQLKIPFYLLTGDPPAEIAAFVVQHRAGAVVADFDPLRIKRQWREEAAKHLPVPLVEVDAHNIVPCRYVSSRQEFGAYTLRPKIRRLLHDFLDEFPPLLPHPTPWPLPPPLFDSERVLSSLPLDRTVPEVRRVSPGEDAARERLQNFLDEGVDLYETRRNDPSQDGQSGLSPFLHFGQLSAQRVALETGRQEGSISSREAFLEELIVRRELSDNLCQYNLHYDSIEGLPGWARETLDEHREDPREFVYSLEEFAAGDTHDPLWNASQLEMVRTGRMHGYLRMYWAKKILEWTETPEEAMKVAIALNDRYQLDGRDPNGYAGISWSIGGMHDRAWGERPIFGKVRYMNDKGCRRKFSVAGYIARVQEMKDRMEGGNVLS
ncbi:deoxyribodipyrimidine photo-lyase [Geomonas sp. RF6]|uniref:deoxyribodipyrimidine photo-lyase n=1 Tax=Geomonas sp. RF6 TaxID=2897342 RepID=UPI001E2A4F09|nr:deoxyribodipyrimidine photo-lyase [Geomonas sp. RF6]UFS70991.1 deoxyribodipyrimidine photo-lyase [Geomonas sp. RF6]